MNIFEVIPDQQTPIVPKIDSIKSFIEENEKVINDFKEYAESRTDAIGLAANQCNLNETRFMLRMAAIKDSKDPLNTCRIAIDPTITERYGIVRPKLEGCLTWKNRIIVADRNHSVDVSFYTTEGELVKETHSGFQAQVWQHEINHLNGVEEVVVDRYNIPELPKEDIGRNEKCPCGSGKKYKQCCIEN